MLNLTKSGKYCRIIGLILACTAFIFLFGIQARAEVMNYDDFESYPTGDIDGNENWNYYAGSHGEVVSVDQAESGVHSLKFNSGAATSYYLDEKYSAYLEIDLYVYIPSGWAEDDQIEIRVVDYGNNEYCALNLTGATSTYFYAQAVGATTEQIQVNVLDAWIDVGLVISPLTATCAAYSNGVYSTNATIGNGASTSVARIYFDANNLDSAGYIDDVGYTFDEGYTDAEVIELPDLGDPIVTIGAEFFEFYKDTFCYVEDTTCAIHYMYGVNEIGYDVYLLYANATTTQYYVDLDEDLPDQTLLEGYLFPTVRSTVQTDNYWIYVYRLGAASSTLYQDVQVHWISTSTADDTAVGGIMSFLRQTFPLGVYLQIRNTINNHINAWNEENEIAITVNDFLPDNLETEAAGEANLISADLVDTPETSFYRTYIYPIITAFIYFTALVIAFFEIRLIMFYSA